MKYNHSDDVCDECSASLTIMSKTTPPEIIETILGLKSNSERTMGRPHLTPSGKEVIARTHGWYLNSEGIINSKDLRAHFKYLLDKLYPIKDKVLDLVAKDDVDLIFYCSWWGAMHCGPTFDPDQMRMMGELGIKLEIFFASYRED